MLILLGKRCLHPKEYDTRGASRLCRDMLTKFTNKGMRSNVERTISLETGDGYWQWDDYLLIQNICI